MFSTAFFYNSLTKQTNCPLLFLQMSVAGSFAEGGVIIALGRFETEVPCFDAEWLSCHQHEKEVLFFGGDSILQIRNIYKYESKWTSFAIEIKAIQAIRSFGNGGTITFGASSSFNLKNMIFHIKNMIFVFDPGDHRGYSGSTGSCSGVKNEGK